MSPLSREARILMACSIACCSGIFWSIPVRPKQAAVRPVADLQSVAEAVAGLRGIRVDVADVNIPAPAKPLLTALKHSLRDLIANRLRNQKRSVSTQLLQARLIVDLGDLGLLESERDDVIPNGSYSTGGYEYGNVESVTVSRPHQVFDVIAVTTTLGICCGEDTSLYLFKYEQGEWKLWLADEKNDYDTVDQGQGQFQFGLSWPDEHNDYFVVTASVNPWCTSNWQSITYRVLRPGQQPYEPRVLLSRSQTIYLGAADPPYRLEVDDSDFTLEFYGDKYSDFVRNAAEGDREDKALKDIVHCRVTQSGVVEN